MNCSQPVPVAGMASHTTLNYSNFKSDMNFYITSPDNNEISNVNEVYYKAIEQWGNTSQALTQYSKYYKRLFFLNANSLLYTPLSWSCDGPCTSVQLTERTQ